MPEPKASLVVTLRQPPASVANLLYPSPSAKPPGRDFQENVTNRTFSLQSGFKYNDVELERKFLSGNNSALIG
jgi:hypothetical protein